MGLRFVHATAKCEFDAEGLFPVRQAARRHSLLRRLKRIGGCAEERQRFRPIGDEQPFMAERRSERLRVVEEQSIIMRDHDRQG